MHRSSRAPFLQRFALRGPPNIPSAPSSSKALEILRAPKGQETDFPSLLARVLALPEQSGEEQTRKVLTQLRNMIKRLEQVAARPYFYVPRYVVPSNYYRVEDHELVMSACLPGAVPEIILYPFGDDVVLGLTGGPWELSLTDSEEQEGVARGQLQLQEDGIAYVSFTGYDRIVSGVRQEVPLSVFVLPLTFAGRYRVTR